MGEPGEKPLGAKERTNNKLDPHMINQVLKSLLSVFIHTNKNASEEIQRRYQANFIR